MKVKNVYLIPAILIFVFLFNSCAVNPVTGKRQLAFMSEAQEIQMGRDYDPQILAFFGEYRNDELQALLKERTREMGLISHRSNLEYHIKILDSPVINAFAVPGGYMYFTRGILAHFNNEAEMIGVLGHEMGHITARHSVSRHAKQTVGQIVLIGGMIASEQIRRHADAAMAGMQLLFLSYSREDEREADRLGVEYASKIGYDAKKMADFYQVLIKMNLASEHGGVPTFLSTHPDPGDRHNAVMQDAAKWQAELSRDEWKVNTNSYLRLLEGMVYGEDPRQGYTDGNVFYHPELKFSFPFPAGWKLENMPTQVRMMPQDGKAVIIFTFARGNSLEEAANNTLQEMQVNVVDRQRGRVHGLDALAVVSTQSSQDQQTGQTQTIRIKSTFIDDNGTYFVFHGVSMEADFNGFVPQFDSAMGNYRKLTDPARINVKPERVSIKEVRSPGTLTSILRSMGVESSRLEEMAFLNNMELNQQIAAGTLIKVVE